MGGIWTKRVGGICIETKMCHFVTEKDGDYFIRKQERKMEICGRSINCFRNLYDNK